MGRRLLEIIPYVPIATTVRTGISIFTYCGNVTFGITGDFAANPDLDVLAHGIEDGLTELLKAAKRHHRPATAKQRPASHTKANSHSSQQPEDSSQQQQPNGGRQRLARDGPGICPSSTLARRHPRLCTG